MELNNIGKLSQLETNLDQISKLNLHNLILAALNITITLLYN